MAMAAKVTASHIASLLVFTRKAEHLISQPVA